MILIGIILLPAVFYSVYEISSLNENEKMISRIYEQQLDALLFSVNQYLWDNLSAWQSRINTVRSDSRQMGSESEYRKLVNELSSLEMLVFSDSLMKQWQFYIKSTLSGNVNSFRQTIEDSLKNNAELWKRLRRYSRARYSKIESMPFSDPGSEDRDKLILFYLGSNPAEDQHIIYLVIDMQSFINDVLAPKLEEVAGDQFIVGVFSLAKQRLYYQNVQVNISQLKQTRPLWLLPNFQLGIRLRGESIEELAQKRFTVNIVLMLGVDLILLLGAFLVFRMVRQQMQLAQMKSDFVSNVSHELRTPLALIRMYAETLELGRIRDEKKQQDYYRIIGQETERLTRLINNILNFSRIESGKKQYHFKETDLNLIVQNLLEMYNFHIQNKGFKLIASLDPGIPKIQADEEAVAEAVLNLLDNAIKYSENEKVIAVRSFVRDSAVVIEIEDHGIGVNAEHSKYIFEKFYRVSDSLVHNTKGSGLGLTLVKHIMEAHQGRVALASTPGKGSCFSLIFPVKR